MAEGIGLLTGGPLDQTQRGRKLENLGDDVVTKVGEGGRSDGRCAKRPEMMRQVRIIDFY